jgi:SAM-dependent methyltransferase
MLARMQEDGSTLAEWLAGPPGRALLDQERAAMAEALECVFGVQCLQVGAWGPARVFLDLARTQRRAWLSAGADVAGAIRSDPANLPIQSDSIDALILPHTLEFAADPHQVLREVERVLTAEGSLLILGFEPLGSWAARHHLSGSGFPPGLERFLPERRLADWLKLLSFDVDPPRRYLYTLPLARAQKGRVSLWAERAGRAVWPRLSGAYLLQAKKRVYAMTPLRPRFRARPAVLAGLAEPTTRVGT